MKSSGSAKNFFIGRGVTSARDVGKFCQQNAQTSTSNPATFPATDAPDEAIIMTPLAQEWFLDIYSLY